MASLCLFHTVCAPAFAAMASLHASELMVHAGATVALWTTLHGLRYHRVRALLLLRSAVWVLQGVAMGQWRGWTALTAAVAMGTNMACKSAEQRARTVFSQEWVQAGVPRRV